MNLLSSIFGGILLAAPFLYPPLYLLAWGALIPLLWVHRRSAGHGKAFLFGWAMGATTSMVGFYWLNYTISVFGGFSYGVSAFIFLLFSLYSGLALAFFSLFVHRFGLGPLSLFPPLFWVAIEFWFPFLFPWHLANSQATLLSLIQSADLVGPYGTSFLLVWANTVLFKIAEALLAPPGDRKFPVREAVVVAMALVGVLFYGHFQLRAISTRIKSADSLTLAAVQGNVSIRKKGNITYMESNLESYKELTRKTQGVTLVIWPESAVDAFIPEDLKQLAPEDLAWQASENSFFVFGVRSFRGNPSRPDNFFNSAFLADAKGRILGRYHKQVLLAFGEYIPFSAVLSKLPGMPPIGGFTPGIGPRTLDISPTIKLAPLICYEDLMPRVARRFVAESGATLLLNLTNDAWFGNTVAPWQHARTAKWRAIETRRTLVRATNTGVTTVINPRGEILESLPVFSSGVLTADVPLMKGQTFYVRFGDWFAWMCTLGSLGIILTPIRVMKIPGRKTTL
ncbi:MAG: apolipoprotein N-acyltransferase [Candidatus Binatia bacterium]